MKTKFHNQKGYSLAVVVVFTTVLLVGMSGVLLNWQTAMQREREEELIFRGKQFMRAIELWQRKFPGTYPTSIDALLDTNNMRFLRKKWKDPITNSDKWRLIKINPDGSISGLTAPSTIAFPGSSASTPFGQSSLSASASEPGRSTGSAAQRSAARPAASSLRGTTSSSVSTTVLGGIVGVASTSEEEGLKTFNGRSKYSEWEFVYIPRVLPSQPTQPGQPGQPAQPGQPGQPGAQRSQPSPGHLGSPQGPR